MRKSDIVEHIKIEHGKLPKWTDGYDDELERQLITHTVNIRRDINAEVHWQSLQSIIVTHYDTIRLTSRWWASIADTFADYGQPHERSFAMVIVMFINTMRMYETYGVLSGSSPAQGKNLRPQEMSKGEMNKQVRDRLVHSLEPLTCVCDTHDNMLRRITRTGLDCPHLLWGWNTIFVNAINPMYNGLWSHMALAATRSSVMRRFKRKALLNCKLVTSQDDHTTCITAKNPNINFS